MDLISSCCGDDVQQVDGYDICTGCGKRCDAMEAPVDQRELAAEYWADSERQGDYDR
jgi:hypothetical protein